jgi:rhamnose utilization protein RhaD (predicted bifunctional aldolase and dehydrogenase)
MSNAKQVLLQLIDMSLALAKPERSIVILGEGNTSAICDDGTFWVKASGTQLPTADVETFVRCRTDVLLAAAEGQGGTDESYESALRDSKVDAEEPKRPSTEAIFHAILLTETGAKFVAHTHPEAVNAIMCSQRAEEAFSGRLFPDEIVVCGPAPAYVPFVDPGLELSRAVRDASRRYVDVWHVPPKVLIMQNHGMIALGQTPGEVDSIMQMFTKTCRVLLGTYAMGGPNFLTEGNVNRIFTRPDEAYRRKALKLS